jgi:hypothetical protein
MLLGYPNLENNHFYELAGSTYPGMGTDFRVLRIMQYTGLLDKNGREIYEGDIVRGARDGETGICPVVWSPREGGFIPFCSDNYPLFDAHTDLEVIGNIYQNPELLEPQQRGE